MNDDGEPSNTAGKPIYNQILVNNLSDILIIVVRYFGGTLLGTGGLITSYKTAAANMLQNAKLITKSISKLFKIDFEYGNIDSIYKIMKEEKLEQVDQSMDLHCFIVARIELSKEKKVISRFEKLKNVKITYLETI
jgi:putative IMPACT (imprinted ancient) family translation regulator